MRRIEGWLLEAEASLLMTTATLALAEHQPHAVVEIGSYCGRSTVVLGSVVQATCPSARVYAIDPHEGELTSSGGEPCRWSPTLERFRANIADAGLTSVVEVIQKRSFEVAWDKPISLLFIDGLHDYLNVSRDVAHFAPWVVDGGYIAFDDYDYQAFPGVVDCVNEVLNSGRYRKFRRVGRMMVIQKLPSSSPKGQQAVSDLEAYKPVAAVVRAILEEGVDPLQAALDERTEWAERMEQEAARRGAVIQELQAALKDQTELAEQRLATIRELETQVERLRAGGGACK